MKKVLSLLLAIVFVFAAFPVTFASAADVIEISDAAQLASIGTNDNYPLSGSYKLTKSINLSGYDSWTPIGQSSAFSGTFEGNGKTISGLKVNTSGTYAGLFGQVTGTIKNLTVTGSVTLNATSSGATNAYAGIIAGYTSGWATIYSCSTTGEVTATASTSGSGGWFGSGSATVYAGGVVGNHTSMNVIEISAHEGGTVSATANATSSANTTAYAGGVVGKANASIVDCYNVADVSATATSSGGNSNAYSGGILGGGTSNILGSIFGSSTKIATSYNSGDVSATGSSKAAAGAIAGDMGNIKAENCYYLDGCCSAAFGSYSGDTAPSATKLSSSASRKESSYSGFDCESVWTMKLLGTPTHISCDNIITGEVSILGYFEAGQTLKADMSKVEPSSAYDGAIKRVKYQWYVGVENEGEVVYDAISGATKDEYTITNDQIGKYIKLEVKGKRAILAANSYGGVLTSDAGKVTAAVPKNVKVENTDNGIKVTWDKISGASQYTIYRSTYSEGFMGFGAGYNSYTSVGNSTTNSYTDSSVTNNTKYKYKVTVTMSGTESDQSAESAEITASLPCQHSWDSGKETTKAKCETAGVKTYTCSLCGTTRTETIPALGHSYNNGTVTKKATCEEAGTKTFTCSTCWNSKTETIPALGHSYGTATVTKAATCEEAGEKTSTCANCGDKKTQTIPATGHTFDATNVIKNPTCTEPGLKRGNCKTCGQYKEEKPAALGHAFSSSFTVDKEATYESEGEKSRHCSRCDARTDVTVIPKLIKITEPVHKEQRTKTGVTITWEKVANATGYNVYKATKSSSGVWSAWSKIKALNSTTLTYTDTYVESGKSYRYAVSATANGEETTYSSNREIIYLAEPVIKTTEIVSKGIKFTWSQVSGVEGYIVYKLVDGEYQQVAVQAPSNTTYIDQKAVNGQTYYYAVASMDYIGNPGSLNKFSVKYDVPVVKDLATPVVKTSNTAKGIKLTWEKVENANSYIVYKRTYNESTKKYSGWTVLNSSFTGTTYTDTKVKLNVIYSYTVKAVNGNVKSAYKATTGLRYKVTPTVTVANASNGVKVNWTTIANVDGYIVYSSTYNTSTKKWSSWKNRGTVSASTTSWTDKNVKSGTYYKYTVRGCIGSYKGPYNAGGVKTLFLKQPTVKFVNTATGIKISWSKTAGAKNYTVYRAEYVNGKWSKWENVGTCGNNVFACVDKGVESGVKYRYTVRAVNGSYRSSFITPSALMFLSQPTVSVAKNSSGIKVTFDKVDGATSYIVYRSEYNAKTKKWSGWKNIGTSKSVISGYTDKTATSGVTYKYTVRAANGNSKSAYKASSSIKR